MSHFGPLSAGVPEKFEGAGVGAFFDFVDIVHGDVAIIGSDTYEFRDVNTSSVITNDTYIGVVVGASVDLTIANFAAAINGTAPAAHPTITRLDLTTPALGRGTQTLLATQVTDASHNDCLSLAIAQTQGGALLTQADPIGTYACDFNGVMSAPTIYPFNTTTFNLGDKYALQRRASSKVKMEVHRVALNSALYDFGPYIPITVAFPIRAVFIEVRDPLGQTLVTADAATGHFIRGNVLLLATYSGQNYTADVSIWG